LEISRDWQNLTASCPSVVTTHVEKAVSSFFAISCERFESVLLTDEYLLVVVDLGAGDAFDLEDDLDLA
jgi:hypothetical protein